MSFYTYPNSSYILTSGALQRWNGTSWVTCAGIGDYSSQSNWQVTTLGPLGGDAYTTLARNPLSFTFDGTQEQAYELRSKYWRLFVPASSNMMSGTDDVWHSNGSGPLNFWVFE